MKYSFTIVAFIAALAFAGSANAQNTATATAPANGRIICGIAITHITGVDKELNFGKIVGGGSAGTVTVPDLVFAATYTGGSSAFTGSGGAGPISPAHFTIYSEANYPIVITGPSNVTITSAEGNTMNVAMFFPSNTSFTGGTTNTTSGGNNLTFWTQNSTSANPEGCGVRHGLDLGGVLSVAAGQAPGTYTGSFTEGVAYN